MKQVKKMPLDENFYFSTINYIRKHNKLPELNISKQLRNYKLKPLRASGAIFKVGYGTWMVDEEKVKEVKKMPKGSHRCLTKIFTSSIRSHGFILTFEIPKISGWHKLKQFLNMKKISYKEVGIHKTGLAIVYLKHKIHLFKRKIIIYSDNSFYEESASDGYIKALESVLKVFKSLETFMSISLKIEGQYKFKVSRQHHAKVNDALAKQYKKEGKRLAVYDKNGLWLITDNSLNMSETETVHNKTAVKDMDKVIIPVLNGFKDYYEKTGEVLTSEKILELFYAQFKVNQSLERNVESLKTKLELIINGNEKDRR